MPDHYDALETRDPAARERELFARAARDRRARHDRAGLGASISRASIRNRSNSRAALAKAAAAAQVRSAGVAKRKPAVRRLQRHRRPARPSACDDVARPDLRAARPRRTTSAARRARVRRGLPRRAISCTMPLLSSHARRLHLEAGAHALGCAVIPGGIGNTEQQLDAIAHYKPRRLCRHAGLHQDPARHRGEDRQGRLVDQARRWCPARRCRPRSAPNSPRAASRSCSAMPSPRLGVISYESEARKA